MTHYISVKDCVKLFKKHGDELFNFQSFLDNIMGMTVEEAGDRGIDEENWWDFLENEYSSDVKQAFDIRHSYLEDANAYILKWATLYAKDKKLGNGSTIKFFDDSYRNEGLLFWDAIKKEIVEPFTEIDDYGSVPPRFVIGDGDFEPYHWILQVKHNSYVFPSSDLIKDIKRVLKSNKDTVTINHTEYPIKFDGNIKDLNSIFIEVKPFKDDFILVLYPGNPEWRSDYKTMKNIQKKRNNTMKQLLNIYEGAPPSSKMSKGGPLYQNAKNSWNANLKGGTRRTRRAKRSTGY